MVRGLRWNSQMITGLLTKKLKYDDPVVHVNGEQISSVGEIRLLGLSPSSQGDVGSESGDREDHIHYRDRAYRSVRFVRLGTGDEEARRAKDARRCPAQRRSEGMPGSPAGLKIRLLIQEQHNPIILLTAY
ncbi:hypothetical protein EVAR_11932_1 [Eumeta japonica]|uniref:Uncharacterized protein n=1 Tax=Eumeta variegata TaxID=151549 RepID=A0A4C1U5S8_EUMVA|nr:hypothetical protein EVAR_11932_1 [Eumeta japonica]